MGSEWIVQRRHTYRLEPQSFRSSVPVLCFLVDWKFMEVDSNAREVLCLEPKLKAARNDRMVCRPFYHLRITNEDCSPISAEYRVVAHGKLGIRLCMGESLAMVGGTSKASTSSDPMMRKAMKVRLSRAHTHSSGRRGGALGMSTNALASRRARSWASAGRRSTHMKRSQMSSTHPLRLPSSTPYE